MNNGERRLELFINPVVVRLIAEIFKEQMKDRKLEDWLVEYLKRYTMKILLNDESVWRTFNEWLQILHAIRRKLKEVDGIDWTGEYIRDDDLYNLANDLKEYLLVANE